MEFFQKYVDMASLFAFFLGTILIVIVLVKQWDNYIKEGIVLTAQNFIKRDLREYENTGVNIISFFIVLGLPVMAYFITRSVFITLSWLFGGM